MLTQHFLLLHIKSVQLAKQKVAFIVKQSHVFVTDILTLRCVYRTRQGHFLHFLTSDKFEISQGVMEQGPDTVGSTKGDINKSISVVQLVFSCLI